MCRRGKTRRRRLLRRRRPRPGRRRLSPNMHGLGMAAAAPGQLLVTVRAHQCLQRPDHPLRRPCVSVVCCLPAVRLGRRLPWACPPPGVGGVSALAARPFRGFRITHTLTRSHTRGGVMPSISRPRNAIHLAQAVAQPDKPGLARPGMAVVVSRSPSVSLCAALKIAVRRLPVPGRPPALSPLLVAAPTTTTAPPTSFPNSSFPPLAPPRLSILPSVVLPLPRPLQNTAMTC